MRALGAAVVACGLVAWGCGSLGTPTGPNPTPEPAPPTASTNPNPGPTPVLGAPAPKPTPTPDPGATPNPSASPTPPPDGAAGCSSPLPPDLARINISIHQRGDNHWLLDSTPIVGPDGAYCAKIGFTDGRLFCPVRMEGNAEREACELYVVGRAQDTGRAGPTWSLGGSSCSGRPVCENSPDNQYQLVAYQSGTYRACGNKNGVCGEIVVAR